MKLQFDGLKRAVEILFNDYIQESELRDSSERIVDDFEELISDSIACEYVIYRTLITLVDSLQGQENYKPRVTQKLLIELFEALSSVEMEMESEDFEILKQGYIDLAATLEEDVEKHLVY
ncbi:hypothetical protein BK124_00605 [Paenibacillus amylolyticus]|uniref:hypothetical protein n=1 Tax=Paenibacillus amylolyticus TaxID=1451 RepID=UPI00096E150E|nr:hypothetical protein [Paenibacillus amylolyticus]OMF01212.1 hypothetical protein BK124_00605 [Paenibacillus amylolyticus]